MVNLAIVGESIAHEYIYTSLLQGHPDDAIFQKNATAWQARLLNNNSDWPITDAVKVTHIYSELEETAQKTAETYGLTICHSLEEAVNSVDGGIVLDKNQSVPLHRPHAEAFLDAGKPVWVEKPFTWSVTDAKALAALSKKKNVPVQSFSSIRFAPEIEQLKQDMKRVGDIVTVTVWGPGGLIDYYNHTLGPMQELVGPGLTSAEAYGRENLNYIRFEHTSGIKIVAMVGSGNKYQWQVYGTLGTEYQRLDNNWLCFKNAAQHMVNMFTKGTVRVPVDYSVELVMAANAARRSKEFKRKVEFTELV